MQAITIEDHRYEQALRCGRFHQAPCVPRQLHPLGEAMLEAKSRVSDLALVDAFDFGAVLRAHPGGLARALPRASAREVRALGFDDRFIRLWDFYLAYCEGGFRERSIGVAHLLFAKPRGLPGMKPLGEFRRLSARLVRSGRAPPAAAAHGCGCAGGGASSQLQLALSDRARCRCAAAWHRGARPRALDRRHARPLSAGFATAAPAPALPAGGAPLWILALWTSFSLTLTRSLAWLCGAPGLGSGCSAPRRPARLLERGARLPRGALRAARHTARWSALAAGWSAAISLLFYTVRRWERTPPRKRPRMRALHECLAVHRPFCGPGRPRHERRLAVAAQASQCRHRRCALDLGDRRRRDPLRRVARRCAAAASAARHPRGAVEPAARAASGPSGVQRTGRRPLPTAARALAWTSGKDVRDVSIPGAAHRAVLAFPFWPWRAIPLLRRPCGPWRPSPCGSRASPASRSPTGSSRDSAPTPPIAAAPAAPDCGATRAIRIISSNGCIGSPTSHSPSAARLAWLSLVGPAVMYVFLRWVSGIPFTEAQALRTRGEDYRRYQQIDAAAVSLVSPPPTRPPHRARTSMNAITTASSRKHCTR